MSHPHSKAEIIAQLVEVQRDLTITVQAIPPERFDLSNGTEWSAASYLKHLILSNKPFVKGLGLPKERLAEMFGQSERPSRRYEALVSEYGTLTTTGGVRAEDYANVTPVSYRMPDGVTDEQSHLIEVWNTTHDKLYQQIEAWSEEDLDAHQLPHPAMGVLTIREMLFFTLYHNTLHTRDIQRVSGTAGAS
ncbi:MAG: DinB family protein [Anaerolineae bacterium]|jgi:hypothetical protein|nr:DinB family protein [Anaerolineae bacterium]